MSDINNIMRQLSEYIRLQEETQTIIDGLKDELKNIMLVSGTDILQGIEHKATYKAYISSRIDTAALKKELPEIAEKYSRTTETKRFIFS